MYCKKCGKEIPNDANYCSCCGANQGNNNGYIVRVINVIRKFVNEHKKIFYLYCGWCIFHVYLYVASSKTYVYYNSNTGGGRVDVRNMFYPFNSSLSDIINGDKYSVSFFDYVNFYDFSELFFYLIIFPLVIYGIIKIISRCFCYCKSWYEKKASQKP